MRSLQDVVTTQHERSTCMARTAEGQRLECIRSLNARYRRHRSGRKACAKVPQGPGLVGQASGRTGHGIPIRPNRRCTWQWSSLPTQFKPRGQSNGRLAWSKNSSSPAPPSSTGSHHRSPAWEMKLGPVKINRSTSNNSATSAATGAPVLCATIVTSSQRPREIARLSRHASTQLQARAARINRPKRARKKKHAKA